MTCSDFDLLIVSDEPEVAAALRDHASGCPRCAEILAGQAELLREVEAWKESTPAPPPQLEQRILQAAARQPQQASYGHGQEEVQQLGREREQEHAHRPAKRPAPGRLLRFPPRHSYAWGAIAATLILAALLVARTAPWAQAPQEATRLLVAEALKDAERAERDHARAIARLEQAAAPILAQSEEPSLAASKAAVLIAYRDRLAYLDSTIAEVEGFLDNNPSHSGGRTVLLAAYIEKTEVLSQIIALEEEWA
jgi:hypothetical protein